MAPIAEPDCSSKDLGWHRGPGPESGLDFSHVHMKGIEGVPISLGSGAAPPDHSRQSKSSFDRLGVSWFAVRFSSIITSARGRDIRQEGVRGSPTQSRISPSMRRVLRLERRLKALVQACRGVGCLPC